MGKLQWTISYQITATKFSATFCCLSSGFETVLHNLRFLFDTCPGDAAKSINLWECICLFTELKILKGGVWNVCIWLAIASLKVMAFLIKCTHFTHSRDLIVQYYNGPQAPYCNLVQRVLGHFLISCSVTAWRSSIRKNFFQFLRFSPGDQPLDKEPDDSGCE